MPRTIEFAIEEGDILQYKADVIALKYAQSFYGPTQTVRARLDKKGVLEEWFQPTPDTFVLMHSQGTAAAENIIFVGVPRLSEFQYAEVRKFTQCMFRALHDKAPGTQHLAMTIHGPRFGLDAHEAFLAQFLVCIAEAQVGSLPGALERITIVERNPQRVQQIQTSMRLFFAGHPGVRPLDAPLSGYHLPVGVAATGAVPHVFVAMPFASEMDDIFYFGIQRPILAAGLLCERVDKSGHFRGSIVERIKERIRTAKIVIADITGARPNVFYEAGYAAALGNEPLLLIHENDLAAKQLDFDIRTDRCVIYTGIEDLRVKLSRELSQILAERERE